MNTVASNRMADGSKMQAVPDKVIYRDSRVAAVLYAIPLECARRQLVGTGLSPLSVAGYAVVNAAWFDYGTTSIGAYREFSLGIMASAERLSFGSVTNLLLGKPKTVGAYVLALPVDSETARAGGVSQYGLPKTLVDFGFVWSNASLAADISHTNQPVLSARIPLERGLPAWLRQLVIFSKLDGRLLTTTITTRWLAWIDLLGRPRLTVRGPSHPLGSLVRELGIESAPALAIVHGRLERAELPRPVDQRSSIP